MTEYTVTKKLNESRYLIKSKYTQSIQSGQQPQRIDGRKAL